MTSLHLLDPELAAMSTSNLAVDTRDLHELRDAFMANRGIADEKAAGVVRREISVPGPGGDIRCLMYSPRESSGVMPAYLHIHGGGYILGAPEMADVANVELCSLLDICILSVDYRLAPEHPIPAPLEDCYHALSWLFNEAESLGLDKNRIAVGGESAGGGLAAALALKVRDESELPICHQFLTYPMLDDRTGSRDYPGDPLTGEFVWTRAYNQHGWKAYLGGGEPGAPDVPARAENLAGLPPAWIHTVGLDLFRDENIAYAQRLMRAGVPTDLIVNIGGCHGFQGIRDSHLATHYRMEQRRAMARAFSIEERLNVRSEVTEWQ